MYKHTQNPLLYICFGNATCFFFLLTKMCALKVFLGKTCLRLFVLVFCFSFWFSNYYFGFHRPAISQTSYLSSLVDRYLGGVSIVFLAVRSSCCHEILVLGRMFFLRVTPENCWAVGNAHLHVNKF